MEALLIVFLVSSRRMERLTEPEVWNPYLIVFLVSRNRVERLTEPVVWKPY
jgi:hypothetical protein